MARNCSFLGHITQPEIQIARNFEADLQISLQAAAQTFVLVFRTI
jgi:hypothetical protein